MSELFSHDGQFIGFVFALLCADAALYTSMFCLTLGFYKARDLFYRTKFNRAMGQRRTNET